MALLWVVGCATARTLYVPDSVTDAELLERVLQIQADLLASVAKYIALIVGVLTGGTSLEDAAQKLFHKGGE